MSGQKKRTNHAANTFSHSSSPPPLSIDTIFFSFHLFDRHFYSNQSQLSFHLGCFVLGFCCYYMNETSLFRRCACAVSFDRDPYLYYTRRPTAINNCIISFAQHEHASGWWLIVVDGDDGDDGAIIPIIHFLKTENSIDCIVLIIFYIIIYYRVSDVRYHFYFQNTFYYIYGVYHHDDPTIHI